jgi:hypothetical protein
MHYEVIISGQPQDPEKLIELAHLVPIAEKQRSYALLPTARRSTR